MREPKKSFIQQKNRNVRQMKDNRSSCVAQKSLCSILAGAQVQNSPVQFTITGGGYEHWAKNTKKNKGKKLEKILDFLGYVHTISDIDFSIDEISAYYDNKLIDLSYTEMISMENDAMYNELKRFVALIRDDEGGHGALKHGDPGKQFLVNRVNSGETQTASSLDIDEYLQWDTLLKREENGIYETYISLLETKKNEFIGAAKSSPFQDVNDLRTKLREYASKERKTYNTQSNAIKQISITTDIRYGSISEDDSKADRFKIPVGAEAYACKIKLSGKKVARRADGNPVDISDVVNVNIQPRAFTGSLSPVYTVEKNGCFYGKPDKDKLSWVTKF